MLLIWGLKSRQKVSKLQLRQAKGCASLLYCLPTEAGICLGLWMYRVFDVVVDTGAEAALKNIIP